MVPLLTQTVASLLIKIERKNCFEKVSGSAVSYHGTVQASSKVASSQAFNHKANIYNIEELSGPIVPSFNKSVEVVHLLPEAREHTNMPSKQSQESHDLEVLQREYRNMEVNRKAFAEESHLVLRKQQQTLEKLRKENEALKTDVATLQTRTALRPISSSEQVQMDRLYRELEKYSACIGNEKNRVSLMEQQISGLRDSVWRKRRSMGGVNAATENQRLVEKQVRILENRLDQALVKFNKSIAHNKRLRQEIDDLRSERVAFEGVNKKLEKGLQDKKKQMAEVIEQSNLAYEQRNRALLEIAAIEQADRKEQEAFDQQMVELAMVLEKELQPPSVRTKPPPSAASPGDEEAAERRAAEQQAKALSREKLLAAQQRRERVQNFEEAFRKIAAATGISDVDELVANFIANEEQNFSLFVYANEQANEIEKIEGQIQELREEQSRYAQESGNDANQYESILRDLDEKLKAVDSQVLKLEQKSEESQQVVEAVKDGIKLLLTRLECDNDIPGEVSVTDANVLHYLGVIEERTNEILSKYHGMSQRDNSGKENQSNATTPLHNSGSSKFETDARFGGNGLLGTGPAAPMGVDPIFINPPKLADYSSDENSGDEGGCSGGGDAGVGGSSRPLTLDELQTKAAARLSQTCNRSRRTLGSRGGGADGGGGASHKAGRRRSTFLAASAFAAAGRRGSVLAMDGVAAAP